MAAQLKLFSLDETIKPEVQKPAAEPVKKMEGSIQISESGVAAITNVVVDGHTVSCTFRGFRPNMYAAMALAGLFHPDGISYVGSTHRVQKKG